MNEGVYMGAAGSVLVTRSTLMQTTVLSQNQY